MRIQRSAAAGMIALCIGCEEATSTVQSDGLFTSTPDVSSTATCFHGATCCPAGSAMRGLDLTGPSPKLECRATGEELQDCFIDHATRRSGIPACPDGTYLRGLNPEAHTLVCCYGRARGFTAFRSDEVPGTGLCGGDAFATAAGDKSELLCRAPDPQAPPAPDPALPGETSGSSEPRHFSSAAHHRAWQRATRNWLARMLDIPVRTWMELAEGRDPRVAWSADPVRHVCHAPLAGAKVCTTVPGCGENACLVPEQRIHYASPADGRSIYALLFFPPANLVAPVSPERPVVLVTHGHRIGHGAIGKEATGSEPDGMYHAAARELAAVAQAIAIAPDARTFGESAYFGESHGDFADQHDYGVLPPLYVLENIYNLGIALNATFGGYRADRRRVTVGGLSLGGWQAEWAGALDARVTGVIVAGAFGQTWQSNQACDTYLPGTCPHPNGASDRCMIVPGLSGDSGGDYADPARMLLDAPDLAALAAPARYLVTWGKDDANFDTPWQRAATRGAQAAYADLGASFEQVVFDAGHEWNTAAADAFVAGG